MIGRSMDAWPADALEILGACPLCRSDKRVIHHKSLTDATFFSAAGLWDLWQCGQCGAGYLDPRPSEASIANAYSAYYTHEEGPSAKSSNGLRSMLANGYRNWRFGASLSPSIGIGRYLVQHNRALRQRTEAHFRYLPKRRPGDRRLVLDYGCGNGDFLARAETIGWSGYGVEPDEGASRVAKLRKFDVRPSLESLQDEGTRFDAVTISHVIEHLHDPLQTLRDLHAIMEPGARLYIETPNFDAVGHQLYGRHWRGLETPRHLILFNRRNLSEALEGAGFDAPEYHPCNGALSFTAEQSRKIAAATDPYGVSQGEGPWPSAGELRAADEAGEHSEFLVVTCVRSG